MRGIGRVLREPRRTNAWLERAQTSGWSFIARTEGDIPNLETQWDGQKPCAPKDGRTDTPLTPDLFGSRQIEVFRKDVRKLQLRIAKAHREGKPGRVKALQRTLTRSLAARVLAVWRVTTNKGKRTPGVDRVVWKTPEEKTETVKMLKQKGYKAQPLRRIYIPKKNGKLRPLSIPTMHDRAMQALYLQALIPIAEETADPNSYGFRPYRSAADALRQCHIVLSQRASPQWILEGDIRSCFDTISHAWLMNNIPMDKAVLGQWLKAGYVDKKVLFPPRQGTPQGGIASPTLANMVLDRLERLLKESFPRRSKVHFVRYADDWIVTGPSKELLEDHVLPLIVAFLRERNLEIAPEKTHVVHIRDGFTFLGQRVRKYGGKCLTQPSPESVKSLLEKTRNVMKDARSESQEWLIETLNPIIRGWANYHRHSAAKATFSKVDHLIWTQLWSWLKRRHPQKGQRWIYKQYFQQRGSRNWIFGVPKGGPELIKAMDIKIVRHVKIKAQANPFDPMWTDYFNARKLFSKLKSRWDHLFGLLNAQEALE